MVYEKGETSTLTQIYEEDMNYTQSLEYEEIIVYLQYPEQKFKIGQSLSMKETEQLKFFLIQHKDNFA